MLLKIKERMSETLLSAQLWIGTVSVLFLIIGIFTDLVFIDLHILKLELKHLIFIDIIGVLIFSVVIITPGWLATVLYVDLQKKNNTKVKKKSLSLKTSRKQIMLRRATNTLLFPFLVFLNPCTIQCIIKGQYIKMGLIVCLGLIIWMLLDYFFYNQLYSRYFKVNNVPNKIWYTVKHNFKIKINVLRFSILLMNFCVFAVVVEKSNLLENDFLTADDLMSALVFELVFLCPSIILMYFEGAKRWLYGFLSAVFCCFWLIAHVKGVFLPLLSKNHLSGFEDYKFIFKKNACEDLRFNRVKLIESKNQTCKIETNYKILNVDDDYYKIEVENDDGLTAIEYVKKKDVRHIREVSHENPKQKDLDMLVESFSRLNNIPVSVATHQWKGLVIQSQKNIKNNTISISKYDKAMVLGLNLSHMKGLINLMDEATFINPSTPGSILHALKNDKNNQFYFSLVDKIIAISDNPANQPIPINSFIYYFHFFARKNNYEKLFDELGYWTRKRISQGDVIELIHEQESLKMLLLYIKEQDIAIMITLNSSNFNLSSDNPRIKRLIEAILKA